MKFLKWFLIVSLGLSGLAYYVLTNFVSTGARPKTDAIKQNMHTLQTAIETYAVDYGGIYPGNLDVLYKEAKSKNYWKDFKNPYSGRLEIGKAADDFYKLPGSNNIKIDAFTGKTETANIPEGLVYYYPVITGNQTTRYFIYGTARNSTFLTEKGQLYFLTNN